MFRFRKFRVVCIGFESLGFGVACLGFRVSCLGLLKFRGLG